MPRLHIRIPWHPALVGALALLLSGCLTPINHPLRAEPGLFLSGSAGVGLGSGTQVVCHSGCWPSSGSDVGVGLSASTGVMAKPTDAIGLILGVEAGSNSQRGAFGNSGSAVGIAHATWQTPTTALGVGVELGTLMFGAKLSAHRRLDDAQSVALWTRYLQPWTSSPGTREVGMWVGGRYPALDIGARWRHGRLALNYAFGTQFGGSSGQLWYIEGRVHDQYWHSVSVSFMFEVPWSSPAIQGHHR